MIDRIVPVLTAALLLAAGDSRVDARHRPQLTDVTIRTERRLYREAPGGKLYLHMFYPVDWTPADSRPAIVFFFGGSSNTGTYKHFEPYTRYFASRGLLAAAADY